MTSLTQTDKRWAEMKLGQSGLTIKDFGCTTTTLSNVSSWFHDKFYTPFKFPSQLSQELSYTKDGLLIWKSTENVLKLHCERFFGFDIAKILDGLKDPGKCVMLEVRLGRGSHWVLATGKFLAGFKIVDPLGGFLPTTYKYGNRIIGGSIVTKV